MQNEVLQCIKHRRSIRKFAARQISGEQLDAVLEAAVWAPSGNNSQCWHFTAIQNAQTLSQLNETVRQIMLELTEKDGYANFEFWKKRAAADDFNFFYGAPTLIIAANAPDYPNAMADCSAAIENMLLTADSLELGSCWINQLRWLSTHAKLREFLKTLGIPSESVICGAVSVGFVDGTYPNPPERKAGTVNIIK